MNCQHFIYALFSLGVNSLKKSIDMELYHNYNTVVNRLIRLIQLKRKVRYADRFFGIRSR